MLRSTLLSVALLCVAVLPAAAVAESNWRHWRGPLGNGVAPKANSPIEWSETKNIKWKSEIPGRGSGSPVVWDDRVFVVTAVPVPNQEPQVETEEDQETPQRRGRANDSPLPELEFKLLCFDRDSGSLRWAETAIIATPHQGTHPTNGFASASPCTDGQHVYAHFGSRGVYCFTMDGQLVWKRDDLGQMNTLFSFGEGSSPTIADDKILIPWDHQGPSYLWALDKQTGDTVWKQDRDEPSCWATPLVVGAGDQRQVIMNGQKFARGYDLATGKELWRCGGQTFRPCASPVAAGDTVFIGSGFRGSFLGAFKLDGSGDIEGTDSVLWTVDKDTPDIASPLLTDGRIYFYKGKSGILTCLDAKTGKPHFSAERIPGIRRTYASPVAAGGYVYLTGRRGTTVVIKDADELEIVATNTVGEGVDATPAPAGDQLFLRGEQHLFCIAE